jgi:hypothetical protein
MISARPAIRAEEGHAFVVQVASAAHCRSRNLRHQRAGFRKEVPPVIHRGQVYREASRLGDAGARGPFPATGAGTLAGNAAVTRKPCLIPHMRREPLLRTGSRYAPYAYLHGGISKNGMAIFRLGSTRGRQRDCERSTGSPPASAATIVHVLGRDKAAGQRPMRGP